jgi:hypothetical protein
MTTPPVTPPPVASDKDKPAAPIKSSGVQFGPTPTPPGSRLKKDKR